MLIAVCDDDEFYRNTVKQHIEKWKREMGLPEVRVNGFGTAEELLFTIDDERDYILYFLDLDLPGMDGVDLASNIKKAYDDAVIVYITGANGFTEKGYNGRPYKYLRKPICYEQVAECLDYAFLRRNHEGRLITFKNGYSNKRLLIKDIIMISTGIHEVLVYTRQGEILRMSLRSSMDQLYEELPHECFVRCHRGYIINMHYVDKFSSTELCLEGIKERIPIGRNYRKETVEKLIHDCDYYIV